VRARAALVAQTEGPAPQYRAFLQAALQLADQLDLSPQAVTTPSVAAPQSQGIEALPF